MPLAPLRLCSRSIARPEKLCIALAPFQYRLTGDRLESGPTGHPTSGKTPLLVDNGKASGRNGSEDF